MFARVVTGHLQTRGANGQISYRTCSFSLLSYQSLYAPLRSRCTIGEAGSWEEEEEEVFITNRQLEERRA